MKKITLRTKIYLTIVGLFALTGVLYAANPFPFSSGVPFPTGVAAAPDILLVSEYCSENIDKIDCNGNATLFAQFPGFGSCREKYMTIAPSQSAAAGFTPRDVFATEGSLVFKVHEGTVTLFTALGGCLASDHNGITFDHVGTFGFDMIVTCQEGNVFRVHGDGTETQIAGPFGVDIEGPAVVPTGFGPHGGEIWVADEDGNAIHAVKNTNPPGPGPYTVFPNILSHVNPESVNVIPNPPCSYCGNAFYLAEQQNLRFVWAYPLSDFNMLGGNVIITSESGIQGADTSLVTVVGNTYVQSPFDPRVPGVNEGSSFIDCAVPTATPTTTPTATFTPTSTPTATATFTPTPTATATFTPTPTATATFTPTPTPTPTPKPTPTPTPGACELKVTNLAISGRDVQITILNHGSTDQFITRLQLSWPQGINGRLTQIKLDGDVLWNGPAANSPINFGVPPLVADPNKRKIDHNSSDVLTFTFENNVAPLNNPIYKGAATFESGCYLDFGLPTPTPCELKVTNLAKSGRNVQITILNHGSTDQFITRLQLSWPQGTNGRLRQITLDGDVLWNGPAHNSPINFGVPPLVADPNKRKIDHNSSDVLTFTFRNNVAPLNNPIYKGAATFESGCYLDFGLPTP